MENDEKIGMEVISKFEISSDEVRPFADVKLKFAVWYSLNSEQPHPPILTEREK